MRLGRIRPSCVLARWMSRLRTDRSAFKVRRNGVNANTAETTHYLGRTCRAARCRFLLSFCLAMIRFCVAGANKAIAAHTDKYTKRVAMTDVPNRNRRRLLKNSEVMSWAPSWSEYQVDPPSGTERRCFKLSFRRGRRDAFLEGVSGG